ncbi:MAG: HDIG domain-containing protein [Deltaproteobacteria bacterium]|nr:HDIG domain-containing protein [Deltaproteobacteria bacterium]
MIPTRNQCLELIRRYGMLPNIVRHSELVTRVALLIAGKLNRDAGFHLDLTLIEAGALLHDITKTMSIQTRENHARTGGELLASLGYPAVAEVVRQHIRLDPAQASAVPVISEAALVNYADKRVKHEEVVGIEERFCDVLKRYAGKFADLEDHIQEVFIETQHLEEKIFSLIDISPEDINEMVEAGTIPRLADNGR